jgi:aryl-alcohol dehydrogenase-like predicted oxidoreductase
VSWLDDSELHVGLGCMRLSTDPDHDEERAVATIVAAANAGVTVFDTARAYDGNERLLAGALRSARARRRARIVTKGGMTRQDGRWIPDGRARALRADCETSLEELDGLPIDFYLVHAPDPRTPWRTTVRALARLLDEGLVVRIGVCNVTRAQLDEAAALAPISAVQVGLSVLDDTALRSGLVDRCSELGITLMAHSPLGGPRRASRLAAHRELAAVAEHHDSTVADAALAWVLGVSPDVVAIPGARRPETAHGLARPTSIRLDRAERERLVAPRPDRRSHRRDGEVVVIMGIPGAGKSRLAREYVTSGFARLNRDERGGTLRGIARALDELLANGTRRVVLDNTYLTRALRSHVVDVAARHGLPARCIWLDTPLATAQVNLVARMLEQLERLPQPEELRELARTEPGVMAPTSQMRALRALEPPDADEGFVQVEQIAFERAPAEGRSAVFVAAASAAELPETLAHDVPYLVFDWRPGGDVADLDETLSLVRASVIGPVESALCPHPAGPPTCWCRPPLPGLLLDFARRHDVDTARSIIVGSGAAHGTLANALGGRYVPGA